MRKMTAMFLASIALFIGTVSVNADEIETNLGEENVIIEVNGTGTAPSEFFENPSDVLSGSDVSLFSTSVPTLYWDLSSSPYNGNLDVIRVNWVYTNYYFAPNSNGELNLDYNISPVNISGTKMQIGLYNFSTRKFVSYYTTEGAPTAQCLTFRNLNTQQHYAFAFVAIRDLNAANAVTGTIRVYQ